MKKIYTYEVYSEILRSFKQGKAQCTTNKLMTKDVITALIEAEKLYCDMMDGVLWFFSKEDYFYTANFYVPIGTSIKMRRQDMDVVVELFGNHTRYNEQWERELIATGYVKGDKRFKWVAKIDDIIDDVKEENKNRHISIEKEKMYFRKATKADCQELKTLWEKRLGKERYVLMAITDAEWEEIERYGRCDVICAPDKSIIAAYVYKKQNKIASAFHVAALHQGQGLGSAILYQLITSAYEENCTKFSCWIREDNLRSIRMHQRVLEPTETYYQQFICKAEEGE